MEAIKGIMDLIATATGMVGGVIIIAGAITSLIRLLRVEIAALRNIDLEHDRRTLRHHFGYYLLLGLEFLVAADILRTIIHPSIEELITLGTVVVIRTVVSVTLNWELSRAEEIKEEHP